MPTKEIAGLVIEESGRVTVNDEMRIVLFGRTGSGKSATGNTILGQTNFRTGRGSQSITANCAQESAERFGYRLHVVDTPGLFDTGMTQAEVIKEVVKCIGMTSPGPHAFILVTRIDRFTQEEQDTVRHLKDIFGEDMMRFAFVLFTRRDDLEYEGYDLHWLVRNVTHALKDLLQECDMRTIAFNNRLPLPERDAQVEELLGMIETNIRANDGRHYTNEMYRYNEDAIVRREDVIREEIEGEKQRERERMENEFQKKDRSRPIDQQTENDKLQSRENGLKFVALGIWEGLKGIFY